MLKRIIENRIQILKNQVVEDKKIRQYRSTQGRSPKQMESSYKAIEWSMIGLIGVLLLCFIAKLF